MMARIEAAGAEVLVHGVSLSEADEFARALVAAREDAWHVPPFDHEWIWDGMLCVSVPILQPPIPVLYLSPSESCEFAEMVEK